MPPPIINNRRPGTFGPRPGIFGPTRPGTPFGRAPFGRAPITPPPTVPGRPPGVPATPPPIVQPGVPSPAHPPTPPGYYPPAPPSYYPPAPPSYPSAPPSYYPPAPPSGGFVRDRRTEPPSTPFDPGAVGYDGSAAPWEYADDGAGFYGDPYALESGSPAWDLWQGLLGSYLDTRNAAQSASGETFPETTAGDVRKASFAFSRELCLPRYDVADLAATRAAWRDALARVHASCVAVPWNAPYPENERFWLSDSLALVQRLAAVDGRRNAMRARADGVLSLVADSDPLTTWQDLRAYFVERRLIRIDEDKWRYPETTVGDVAQVVRLLEHHEADIVDRLPAETHERGWLLGHVRRWHSVADAVKAYARQHASDDIYPGNAGLWRESRRVAIALSTAYDLVRTPGFLDLVARRRDRSAS
jgi:hypothetical protein